MAYFSGRRRAPPSRRDHPQGAKNEALQILCATLLTPRRVVVHNVPRILDVMQLIDLLRAMGGRGGAAGGRHLCVLRPRDRPRLPADRGLPPPLRTAARLGHAHRAAAGTLRRGGTSPSRAATKSGGGDWTPISSVSRNWEPSSISTPPRSSSRSTARVARLLHAARRGVGDGYGQHRHGRRHGQGDDDDLQRCLRALRAAVVPDAQPHGRTHIGYRFEPAYDRRGRGARRDGTHAAARHDRGGVVHRHGGHDAVGVAHQGRFVRRSGGSSLRSSPAWASASSSRATISISRSRTITASSRSSTVRS